MPGVSRKEQNRIAQRNFRQRKIQMAQKTKEELESLTAKYEALLHEHESLKSIQTAPDCRAMQESEGGLQSVFDKREPRSVGAPDLAQLSKSATSVSSVQRDGSFNFSDIDSEFFLRDPFQDSPRTPEDQCDVSATASDAGKEDVIGFSPFETNAPAIQASYDAAAPLLPLVQPPTAFLPPPSAQSSLFWPSSSRCAQVSDGPGLPDLPDLPNWGDQPSNISYGSYDALSGQPLPPLVPSLDLGPTNGFASFSSRSDIVQAVLQAACIQNNLAYFELQAHQLRASQCGYGHLK